MVRKTFSVPNINCHHCTTAIERELKQIPGVLDVTADVHSKQVTVEWEPPATWEGIRDTLAEIHYPVAEE